MSFQLDKFLAEQDAIAAMPDEDVDSYLRRLSTQSPRRMNWTDRSIRDVQGGKPSDAVQIQNHESSIIQEEMAYEIPRWEQEESSKPQPVNAENQSPQVSEVQSSMPGLGQAWIPQADISHEQCSSPSSVDSTSHSDPLITFSPTAREKRKRHSQSDSYPRKRLILSPDAPAGATNEDISESHSPILSFTKPEEIAKPCKNIVIDQGPQLELFPVENAVDKPARKRGFRAQATPRTTDSERLAEGGSPSDPLAFSAAETRESKTKKRAIPLEPSKLMLELKERVARASSRSRSKADQVAKTVDLHDVPGAVAPMDESSIIYVSSSPVSRAASPVPVKNTKKQAQSANVKGKQPAKSSSVTKAKKEKPKPVSPFEYAESLKTAGLTLKVQRKNLPGGFLEGYNVFYTSGDKTYASETTRRRMELLVRHGGNLIPRYDPGVVTHIITEAPSLSTLKALGLKKLNEIPNHIPTVKWSWVTLGMGYANYLPKDEVDEKLQTYLFQHAAFSARVDAGLEIYSSKAAGKAKQQAKSTSMEDISDFTQEQPQASTSAIAVPSGVAHPSPNEAPRMLPSPSNLLQPPKIHDASSSRITLSHDPLAEFYEQAKVELAQDKGFLSSPESDNEDDAPAQPQPWSPKKSRWTCDIKDVAISNCPNQDIIDKLSELMELHKAKPAEEDRWRAFAYSKAIRALKYHPGRIKSYEEALTLRNVGDKTARKIAEILETGDLRRIGYEKTEDVEVARRFQGIYGVGRTTAYKWYSAGCRTLDDLRNGAHGVKLNSAQEIGLQFYDDINERMPRSEAEAIYNLIEPIALSIDPKLFIRIMGSFRRGKADCGDIDILITRPTDDGKTHLGVLPRLHDALRTAGILTEDLATPDDPHDLEATYRGLCRLPNDPRSKRRRIDFLTVPWRARGAALLYYTGDDIFNRALRYKAGAMGYSLNQRGLYSGIVRDPHDRRVKLSEGHVVASETEEEILKILGVPWQEPHERVRN